MDLTEKTIDSETLVNGVLIRARRDRVRLPDGGQSVREWLDHPGASAVVPIFDDQTTVLIRQFRYPPRRVFWEVPAGKLDRPDEDPDEVARREVEEEIGWKVGRIEPLGSLYPCIGYSNEIIHLYLGFELSASRQRLEDGELLDPVRMPFAQAVDMVFSGEIQDMKTATALMLASKRLKNR